MRAARARWKVENEIFNTLKNTATILNIQWPWLSAFIHRDGGIQ
jgi:hypothetical protein